MISKRCALIKSMVTGFIDRLFAAAGAIAFTQIPLFYQQYVQRLSGHLAELELQTTLLRQTAARSGKSLEAYIDKFLGSSDTDFSAQGQFMQGIFQRLTELQNSYQALINAPDWVHPMYLLRYGDPDIARATLSHFEPGLSFSVESAVYALLGLAVGLGIFRMIKGCLSIFKRDHSAVVIDKS